MHVPSSEIVIAGLAMPHSPRLFDGRLYFLNSSAGELMVADPESGTAEVVNRMPGFLRGMSRYGDYLFVGLSKIRTKHMFSDMPIAQEQTYAGIVIVHLESGALAGSIRYLTSCEEIYDVHVLPGMVRPGILNHTTDIHRRALTTPTDVFWAAEALEQDKENPPAAE